MKVERLQRAFLVRSRVTNEGQAFPLYRRADAITVMNNAAKDLLPFNEQRGIAALRTVLKAETNIDQGTRAATCVSLLTEEVLDSLMNFTEKEFNKGNYGAFIALHDFSFGFSQALGKITMGRAFIAGRSDEEFDEAISAIPEDLLPPMEEQAGIFLDIRSEAQYCADLLAKDPSGIELLEDFVERLRNPKSEYMKDLIGFSEVPEFIVAGAELALDYYKKIYPLSE